MDVWSQIKQQAPLKHAPSASKHGGLFCLSFTQWIPHLDPRGKYKDFSSNTFK